MKKIILGSALVTVSLMAVACDDSGASASASCFTVEKTGDPCGAIVLEDFGTWKFIRKDSFGEDAQYVYTVEGDKLILTTTSSSCQVKRSENSYAMYTMSRESDIFFAYNAVVSTCESGQ